MSCETCRDLLIELVCDELAAEMAAAVRAHALKCERCGPELEKLTRTLKASSALSLLSPSPEVEHRIMQAAREAIAGRARGPAREAATAAATYGGITEWFARLGSFAMSPQVAMASVLLLVVGIGLYALPFGRDAAEPSALRATEDEGDEHAAAAPSPAASATATPTEERGSARERELDEQQGEGTPERKSPLRPKNRAEDRGDPLAGARARRPSASTDKAAAVGRASQPVEARGSAGAQNTDLARESKQERSVSAFPGTVEAHGSAREQNKAAVPESKGSAGAVAAKPKSAGKALSELADDFAPSPSGPAAGGAASGLSKKAGGSRPPAQPSNSGYDTAAAPSKSAQAAAPAPPAAPVRAEPAAKSAEQAKSDASSALAQGIAAIKRGDHAQAEALLKPIAAAGVGSDRSTAILWLARSLRERGDCTAALTFYRTLTQSPSAPRAVLQEAADCHDRTGNGAAAERLRSRAALPAKQ
jgi:hypothetical protein